ncbi:3,4-dihydroxy-2-butanone-4-phosphate synthase [Methanosarcinales archaeon]|nr:MAG: 3,4-dihydroxy-2-butanone-4-phosphate synthase [Methanosarcinales archaeon]
MKELNKAIDSLKNGKMILLYDADNREGETDFVIPARSTTPRDVAQMRKDGGGLICVAISAPVAKKLGLPFMSDLLKHAGNNGNKELATIVEKDGDIKYDHRSSFSIWVNHRDTCTGIPDNDRALTINRIAEVTKLVEDGGYIDFGSQFRCPGHVAILRAADKLLEERAGQTELSIALAQLAGITSAMVVCEMLDEEDGRALSKQKARQYAKKHNFPFIEGKDVNNSHESCN